MDRVCHAFIRPTTYDTESLQSNCLLQGLNAFLCRFSTSVRKRFVFADVRDHDVDRPPPRIGGSISRAPANAANRRGDRRRWCSGPPWGAPRSAAGAHRLLFMLRALGHRCHLEWPWIARLHIYLVDRNAQAVSNTVRRTRLWEPATSRTFFQAWTVLASPQRFGEESSNETGIYLCNDGNGPQQAESAATGALNEMGNQRCRRVAPAVASSNLRTLSAVDDDRQLRREAHSIQGRLDLQHTRCCICESHALWCLVSTVDRHYNRGPGRGPKWGESFDVAQGSWWHFDRYSIRDGPTYAPPPRRAS